MEKMKYSPISGNGFLAAFSLGQPFHFVFYVWQGKSLTALEITDVSISVASYALQAVRGWLLLDKQVPYQTCTCLSIVFESCGRSCCVFAT